tara:strand:- start:10 stop:228 length:219 start_codon:yes stop_codon:yes gene_type:complete
MSNVNDKLHTAITTLKADVQYACLGDILTEENFNNNILWNTGVDENGTAITTTTCPHSEITWTKVKAEMDKL